MTASPTWIAFESAARELRALEALDALAGWDQETYMPPKGAESRGSQRAVLRGVIHEKLTSPRLGDLIEGAAQGDLDERQHALLRVVRRDRDREMKLPGRLVVEIAEAQGRSIEAWKSARADSVFSRFQPHLERLLELRKEEADARGWTGDRYDPLLENNEPGMTTAQLQPVFERLRDGLVPLVNELTARPPARTDFLSRDAWDTETQYAFSLDLLQGIRFELEAGRLDRSVHPFCSGNGPDDVRLTTRLFRNDGSNGIFSALHEGGHGLYEQGMPRDGTPLSNGASMGLHESQSRLWENIIGRSRPFWTYWFPKLKERFPQPLADVSLDEWLAAINNPRRSLIRVDADEVTYNLHILVRFELELAMLHGDLKVCDLPGAWNEKYEKIVGIRPPDDRRGVLQDIHWAGGDFGYFPTYAIGNMYAATLITAVERDVPGLWSEVERGNLLPLLEWLRAKVHRYGRARSADETVREAAGRGLNERDLLAYLRAKHLHVYQ